MDDVQHLRQHAKEESYLFLCDSKLRDRDVHPTPSEYEVRFASPFRNVFSIDLIDATVPRTEYIIEAGNNTVTYALQHPADVDTPPPAQDRYTANVAPGDYTLPQLVEALNAAFAETAAATLTVPVLAAPATVPSELSNKLKFTHPDPFTLLMGSSSMRDALGFANPVNEADRRNGSGVDQYAPPSRWTSTLASSDMFLSVPQESGGVLALEGPVPVDAAEGVYLGRRVKQNFVAAASGTAQAVTFFGRVVGQGIDTLDVQVYRTGTDELLGIGNAERVGGSDQWRATLAQQASDVVQGDECYVLLTGYQQSTAQNHVAVFRAQSNIDLPGGGGLADVSVLDNQGNETPIPETNQDLCLDLTVATATQAVTSPGLVNLTGERYVTIRCPEVEQHMYRDRAFERYHAGLGMIKLSGYGYRDQRYDFVSFPPRKFHVLGKLSKLTIRLEKPDGTLYNAHGVDHTLLMVIRYYAQSESSPVESVLNPHYRPELHRYLPDDRWAAEEDEEFNRPWR
jgi:hypothetical protein